MVIALNGYVVLGGADFGGGVWDLFATGPRKNAQRELIAGAIGPIWEANHVWLIVVVVLTFAAFPPVFALLGIALHIPLTLMLIGIVLRGSAFAFRSYETSPSATERRWGRTFAIASLLTPVLLGVCIGAVATERVGNDPLIRCVERQPGCATESFAMLYVHPWLNPFSFSVGLLTLVLFAFLAAVYLTVEAERDATLQEDFRVRALIAAAVLFVAAFGTLLAAFTQAPRLKMLMTSLWAIPLHVATAIAAITSIVAVWRRRYRVARFAAAAQVSFILWGWAVAQYPYLIPPRLTIAGSAAPDRTLGLLLIALVVGALVLFPSLYYLFRVFKSVRRG
jgi:cytochrome d ubiquinol oxidase subunit II